MRLARATTYMMPWSLLPLPWNTSPVETVPWLFAVSPSRVLFFTKSGLFP
ncbi:MAG TPA: hypothetical protein VFN73_02145 [Propionibacteriaceae bacterium]|nr:hypothetical protein [Propionibacteriaceae bacterium]